MNTYRKHVPKRWNKASNKNENYPTNTAGQIASIMKARNVRGKYKDHVLFVNDIMIDWLGTYKTVIKDQEVYDRLSKDGIIVIHKKFLYRLVGLEAASRFWKCGMRTNYGVESRKIEK